MVPDGLLQDQLVTPETSASVTVEVVSPSQNQKWS